MKVNQLLLSVLVLAMSCSVVKDHPKQVSLNNVSSYLMSPKIVNEVDVISETRNACMNIGSNLLWDQLFETTNYIVVQLEYKNIT